MLQKKKIIKYVYNEKNKLKRTHYPEDGLFNNDINSSGIRITYFFNLSDSMMIVFHIAIITFISKMFKIERSN